ncbi:MAG: tetratricopeptide repeat protein [Candidatus Omnitrophica bacterium]|nr:tetratricopeptide repeat protein [Candidatus Omnitrophota bacterium]
MRKILAVTAVIFAVTTLGANADQWDDLVKEALKQRPSQQKRKTRSGKRLLREKRERIAQIDAKVPDLIKKGDYQKAEELFKEALRLTIELYHPDHLRVAERFLLLGILYMEARMPAKAEEVLLWSLKIGEPILGEGDYRLGNVYLFLARAYFDQNKYELAAEQATLYLMICKAYFGDDNPRTVAARDFLGDIYAEQQKKK